MLLKTMKMSLYCLHMYTKTSTTLIKGRLWIRILWLQSANSTIRTWGGEGGLSTYYYCQYTYGKLLDPFCFISKEKKSCSPLGFCKWNYKKGIGGPERSPKELNLWVCRSLQGAKALQISLITHTFTCQWKQVLKITKRSNLVLIRHNWKWHILRTKVLTLWCNY